MLNQLNQYCYLYVEDDPKSREVLDVVMSRMMGLKDIIIFEDSTDFMNRLSSIPYVPDIILLDIHMEPYTGFEMLDMLRNHPEYAGSRIIALTASVMNEEIALLKDSGFDAVIAKPIDIDTFPGLLERIVEGEQIWNIGE